MKQGEAPARPRVSKKSRPRGRKRGESATSSARIDAFVAQMTSGANITQTDAAIAAGYAPRNAHVQASRLMKDETVRARIKEAQARAAEICAMSVADRMSVLIQIARGELLAPLGVSEGLPVEGRPKHSDRLKGIDMLNKMTGAYPAEKREVTVAEVPATAEQLRAALEHADRLAALRKAAGEE